MAERDTQFPLLYHTHHSRHLEDLPFWKAIAARRAGALLELGCGTGRVLLPLAETGLQVYGLDTDAGMLAVLKRNVQPQLHSWVHVWISNVTHFHLHKQFTAIILPCNTLSTFSKLTRQAMLANVRRHLAPEGLFAASLPNPERLVRLPAASQAEVEEIFPHPQDGEPVQVSSHWKRQGQTFKVYWDYDHLLPDGRVERVSAQVVHQLSAVEVYIKELNEAGFAHVQRYGDFDVSEYTRHSPYLILVAGGSPARIPALSLIEAPKNPGIIEP
jgi:SAM-dependent methyltransferase